MESSISTTLLEKHGNVRDEEQSIVRIDGLRVCPPGCGFSDEKRRAEDAFSRSTAARKLGLATLFCLIFVAVEVVGGLLSNSLAILTDAAHLLSDVAGFAISLFAIWASSWEATPRQSYGFFRLEILGALLSIQLIWLLTGIIVYEAIYRLIHTGEPVDGRLMFLVASFGLVVNIVMVFLLGHGHGNSLNSSDHKDGHGHDDQHQAIGQHHDGEKDAHDSHHDENHGNGIEEPRVLPRRDSYRVDIDIDGGKKASKVASDNINVRGAWLHVLGDLIQSVGVMIGGAVIWVKPEWQIVDLICTLLFSALVLFTTVRMLRDILEILMESTPREIDVKSLEKGLIDIEGVIAIHELHIWAITMGKTLLACHVTIHPDANADVILHKVISYCEQAFNISHVTVQIERKRGILLTNGDL